MESIFRNAFVALQRGRPQGVVGMGIRGVMVVMAVLRPVAVVMGNRDAVGLASPCAFPFAERAAFRDSFHVVVVAFLRASNVLFEAQHLGSVLAERAVHGSVASQHFLDPLFEGVHHQCCLLYTSPSPRDS